MNIEKLKVEITKILNEFYQTTGIQIISIKAHFTQYLGENSEKVDNVIITYDDSTFQTL